MDLSDINWYRFSNYNNFWEMEKSAKKILIESKKYDIKDVYNYIKSNDISECRVTIKEGKFHQVKRMFEAVDKRVIYLKRLSMGPISLDDNLESGEYRELNDREMQLIEEYL